MTMTAAASKTTENTEWILYKIMYITEQDKDLHITQNKVSK